MTKKEIKEKWTLGILREMSVRRLLAHQNWAREQGKRTTRISSHYLTNEWTLQPVRWTYVTRRGIYLGLLSLSGTASTWTFSALLKGTDLDACLRCLPVHGVATRFISSRLIRWLTRGSSDQKVARPTLARSRRVYLHCSRGGDFLGCHS